MYREQGSASELVRLTWRAVDDGDREFTVPANEYWGVAFTRRVDGSLMATIAGPSFAALDLDYHAGEEHWGVEFEVHVAWRGLDKRPLLGRLVDLEVDDGRCEIGGVRVSVPDFDGLEDFVDSLAAQGVLSADGDVLEALQGPEPAWSARTMRRRFRSVTGSRRSQIEQVRRARHAYALLQGGETPAGVAARVGYSDQAHLTRSLRLLAGQTPAQILRGVAEH